MTLATPRTEIPEWFTRAHGKALLNERWFSDAQGRPHENNWHHIEWLELAERHRKALIEAAREHSKTQLFAILEPLVEMGLDTNIRILLISDVHEKSQERTRVLREHIEKNERYREDCPHVRIVRKDGDSKFWLERDRYYLKEATVTSTYAGAPISGGRYDLIIADDLVNYLLNASTPGKRQKLKRWWNDEVMNSVAEGGRVWVIGTHQHHDDLYEEVKRDPSFATAIYPAVDEEDTGYGHLGYIEKNKEVEGADATVLWPAMHDYAAHMAKKDHPATHDSYLRQQQQLAVPETGLVYRKPLMDRAFENGKHISYNEDAAQFIGLDPGYGIRASMLCIQESAGDRVELWREHSFTHMADDDIARVVVAHCKEYGVAIIYIDEEDPGLAASIRKELKAEGVSCGVQRVPFNKYKRLSIKATRWLLETGRVAWGSDDTTVHTPGRTMREPSIFRREVTSYALKDGEDDMPQKEDDHGPDAWVAYAARWIKPWLRATGEREV